MMGLSEGIRAHLIGLRVFSTVFLSFTQAKTKFFHLGRMSRIKSNGIWIIKDDAEQTEMLLRDRALRVSWIKTDLKTLFSIANLGFYEKEWDG